jgi:hypothetical protein
MPEFIDLRMGEHRKSENIFIPMQPASILREIMHRKMNYSESPDAEPWGAMGTGSAALGRVVISSNNVRCYAVERRYAVER